MITDCEVQGGELALAKQVASRSDWDQIIASIEQTNRYLKTLCGRSKEMVTVLAGRAAQTGLETKLGEAAA